MSFVRSKSGVHFGDFFSYHISVLVETGIAITHWGRAMHICVSKLTTIASDNGSSPGRHQAIIWNNAGMLSIGLLWTNFSEILIANSDLFFQENALESVVCEMATILSWPQCDNLITGYWITSKLSCHVQNLVVITLFEFGLEQNEVSLEFELWWKNC